MLTIYIRRLMGVSAVTEAWSSICPTKSFFGMTLDQYKESVKPCYDLRVEIAETRKRLKSLTAKCRDADAVALKLTKNIVHAVKADPTEGEDSPLYGAMGYVRASDRSSGLTRGRTSAAAALAVESEKKREEAATA
jgi:hypothetical protein